MAGKKHFSFLASRTSKRSHCTYISKQLSKQNLLNSPSQRNSSETSSYKLLFGLTVTVSRPLETCLHFVLHHPYLATLYHHQYHLLESGMPTSYSNQTRANFKVFNSGFRSALYKQVILAPPGRKISVSSATPREWLAPIAQLVTLTQQLSFPFISKGTVWAKQGSCGAMNPLIDQREILPHKCFICY